MQIFMRSSRASTILAKALVILCLDEILFSPNWPMS